MKSKTKKKAVLGAVAGIVVIGAVVVVSFAVRSKSSSMPEGIPDMKRNGAGYSLTKMDLVESVSATGTIASSSSTSVSAKVQNVEIKEISVKVGDEVKKEDVLVTFDSDKATETLEEAEDELADVTESSDSEVSDAQENLSDAQSTYKKEKAKADSKVDEAKKAMKEAKAEVADINAKIKKAKDDAEKQALNTELERAKEAYSQAESSYDNACDSRDSIIDQQESNIKNAKKSLETAKNNREKNVENASKQVDSAEEALEDYVVYAASSGIVTTLNYGDGDSYNGGDILTIEDNSSYTVATSVDEYDISKLEVGQRVVILTEATGDDELNGEITFIAPTTTSSQSMTSGMGSSTSSSEYEVEIAVKETDDRLKMGMTARCSIILSEEKDVYAVPYDAVKEAEDGSSYITVNGEEGQKTITVTKGMESDYYVAIYSDELSEGLKVVVPTETPDEVTEDSSNDGTDFMNMPPGGGFGGNANGGNGGGKPDMRGSR